MDVLELQIPQLHVGAVPAGEQIEVVDVDLVAGPVRLEFVVLGDAVRRAKAGVLVQEPLVDRLAEVRRMRPAHRQRGAARVDHGVVAENVALADVP